MIQILVCDKVYVTPEMRRKKFLYKIYFIISIFVVIALSVYYVYAEYDRNKSEEVSQEILQGINVAMESETVEQQNAGVTVEDDVIVVVLNDEMTEEINVDELIASTQEKIEENEVSGAGAEPVVYTAKDGTQYSVIAIITIPKLNITYPVLSNWSRELLTNATCKYMGPDPNEVGNFVILGHNYRDEKANKFFTNLNKLEIRDIIQIKDMSGRVINYAIYSKEVIEDNDLRCTDQNTNGKKEITLITCHDLGKRRLAIKAIEV